MRLVHLIDYFQPRLGYQETYLAKAHQKLGHRVLVVTSDRYYPFPHYRQSFLRILGPRLIGRGRKIEEGIDTFRLPSLEIPHSPLIFLLNLKKTLRDFHPELVFCHGVYSPIALLVAQYKKDLDYRLIFDTHAAEFNTDFNKNIFTKIYHLIYKKFAGLIIENADKILAVGEAEKEFLVRDFNLPKNRVEILRVGIDSTLFSFNLTNRNTIRRKLGIKNKEVVLIYAGKIIPGKDLEVLFESVKSLLNLRLKLLVIGAGRQDYLESLKKIALPHDRFIWFEFMEHDKLPPFFSAADIAVWPGDPSVAMLEALACGLPLIIPDWYGTSYLQKAGLALTFPRGNSQKLAKLIKYLSENDKLKKKISTLAKNYAKKELSWEKIAEKAINI